MHLSLGFRLPIFDFSHLILGIQFIPSLWKSAPAFLIPKRKRPFGYTPVGRRKKGADRFFYLMRCPFELKVRWTSLL